MVGEEGSPRIARLRARVFVSSLAEPDGIEELWRVVLQRSVLVATLSSSVDLDLSYRQVI